MSWPNPPYPFANATSPEAMAFLDQMFDQVGAMIQIPCTAAGTNAISLTPNLNCPALNAYHELGGYRFRAVATTTGAVTAQYNGLGFLPVYHADGVTQANVGDLVIGEQYIFMFSQALNGGLGGFFFESPSQPVTTASWYQPGGRLTFQSATPVMFTNQTAQQTVFYAPYQHPFVPIYNGSIVQMVQFTSSLSDQVGLSLALAGSANWPVSNNFDVFVTLNGGVPTLGTVQWTNQTTRALTLAVFAGFLTNSGATTLRIGAASTIPMAINQGTFLGTFATTANGQSQWVFGGAGSGGVAASFNLCNYYNKVLFDTIVTDNGASYTYTSATVRQARNASTNSITYVQSDSERAALFSYLTQNQLNTALGSQAVGLGFNSTTTYIAASTVSATSTNMPQLAVAPLSQTGLGVISANESSDGTHANTFDFSSGNQLQGSIWM